MSSSRSLETIQREHELQAPQTVRINLQLQQELEYPNSNYREKVEDLAVFANSFRALVPANTLVILHDRPEIIAQGEGDDYGIQVFVSGNCWRFKVNSSVHYELEGGKIIAPGRTLLSIWLKLLSLLPENFIIRGVVDPNDPSEETVARTKIQQGLGFCLPQENNEVYGIIKSGKLTPLTLSELLQLTGKTPGELDQRLNVRTIVWPGA